MTDDANAPLIYGPYTVLRELDRGANQMVYVAQHDDSEREVMLRVVRIERRDAERLQQQSMDQLSQFAALDIPHIVPIETYGVEAPYVYIVMPLIRGGTLQRRFTVQESAGFAADPLPSPGEVAEFVERMAQALDEIHANNMVHGQVVPHNILLGDQGQALLADMGLSRLHKIAYGLGSTNTLEINQYSAPELWDGERPLPASDQYALAAIAYRLLTGRPPLKANSLADMVYKQQNEAPLPPHFVRKDLPITLALPFIQALAKPPKRRHRSVIAFADEFAAAIVGQEGQPTGFFART